MKLKHSTEGSDIEAKDHTRYLVSMMALAALASVSYTFNFRGDYRDELYKNRSSRKTDSK